MNSVGIVGAGLFGLITAKIIIHESAGFFDSVTIFEKEAEIGGVWRAGQIYPGLASNSPARTYEIPGFKYPEAQRKTGSHVSAESINAYLKSFSRTYGLEHHISFETLVSSIFWDRKTSLWTLSLQQGPKTFNKSFKFLVICNGMYHEPNLPGIVSISDSFTGKMFHSRNVGAHSVREQLSGSLHNLVVGAGKSALDLATALARQAWAESKSKCPHVTLLYRKPHWLSPRVIIRSSVFFERVMFSRFVNAWLPFSEHPDRFHRWSAQSSLGKICTHAIFALIEDDFIKGCGQQDLPLTVPDYPIKQALSGALHVEPLGYLNLVRDGKITILQGELRSMKGSTVTIRTRSNEQKQLKVDSIVWATGYTLSMPFFSPKTLRELGILPDNEPLHTCDTADLSCLRLYRLLVPPNTTQLNHTKGPFRNIAFNGFAYSLLNPTVAYVSAHWIADYFSGNLYIPSSSVVQKDIDRFYAWQKSTFGVHGAKGTHIGSHATLFVDRLIADMGLRTGHVHGLKFSPIRFVKEWCRPMYPQIYSTLPVEKTVRNSSPQVQERNIQHREMWKAMMLFCFTMWGMLFGHTHKESHL